MSATPSRGRTLATRLLGAAIVVLGTMGVLLAVARAMPGASTASVYVVSGALATLVVYTLHRVAGGRLLFDGIDAVSDGLLSLTEGDFGVRLTVPHANEVGRLIARFNALAEKLRRERSGVYQKEMLLEAVLAASTSIAAITNEAGRIVYANPAAEQFFDAGRGIEGRLLPELLARAAKEVQEAALAERDVLFTCERADAEPETFHLSKHHFEISTQRHTLLLLRPLTKELARQEVETWKKAIRVLSHEVNNSLAPVTSLVHSARLMTANPVGHEKRLGAALDTIEERATHLKTFLDGYASFARLPMPTKRAVPWRDVLAGVEGLYTFKVDGALPAAPAFADASQLQQVIINLLKNAAESGSAPDGITLAIRDVATGGAELTVADRGKGMAPEVLRSALLPFFSTKKTGTGLGLALCREIIEAHGGRLSLHPREGGGLAVTCWLPPAVAISLPPTA
ncbi:MAG TPA: ATP-binding protein [Polyangia bacterium]|nr:ATP-binding protein [Polyangia bacterium]